MRLNPECIRDILLAVEGSTDCNSIFRYSCDEGNHPKLAKYSHNEIYYHMKQCDASGYFFGFTPCDGGDFVIIRDLSPAGHEFLANIRSENVWGKTKAIASDIGSTSIGVLSQIASNVLTELVRSQFGIT